MAYMRFYGTIWDSSAVLKFIGLYEEEPVLWDPNNPKFEHERKSNEAWAGIRDDMGPHYKDEDCKLKMFTLKRMYHKNKRENTIPNKSSNDYYYFRKLDSFLGKTSTYITTANSTQVEKIGDIESVKVALDQKLRDITKDLATKDDVKLLTQQVANLQLENNTLGEKVEKIGDIEGVKVALDEKLRDITKDLATTKDDLKELTQQVVNLQLQNNTPREEVEKLGDIEGIKVALDEKLRDITKDLATTKDDVKELTQQVVNLQLENNTPREEVEKIGDIEGVKVALDQKLRDITKDLATTKDDLKELTQQVVNLQLQNNTPREEPDDAVFPLYDDSAVLTELREANERAEKAANAIKAVREQLAVYDKKDVMTDKDIKMMEEKQKELMAKMEEFEEITKKVQHLVGPVDVASSVSGPPQKQMLPVVETVKKDGQGAPSQPEDTLLKVENIGDVEGVKVEGAAATPQMEDSCSHCGKSLVEKVRQLPERERLNMMLEIFGTLIHKLDVK